MPRSRRVPAAQLLRLNFQAGHERVAQRSRDELANGCSIVGQSGKNGE
jgi:hypothetical protein